MIDTFDPTLYSNIKIKTCKILHTNFKERHISDVIAKVMILKTESLQSQENPSLTWDVSHNQYPMLPGAIPMCHYTQARLSQLHTKCILNTEFLHFTLDNPSSYNICTNTSSMKLQWRDAQSTAS